MRRLARIHPNSARATLPPAQLSRSHVERAKQDTKKAFLPVWRAVEVPEGLGLCIVWLEFGLIFGFFGLIGYLVWRDIAQTERLNKLEQSIAMVLQVVLEKMTAIEELKEFVPAFTINQNPLQGLFDAIASNMRSNIRSHDNRDDTGKYSEITEGVESGAKED